MTAPVTDAWEGRVTDQSECPTCGRENCEGHDQDRPEQKPAPRRWQTAADTIETAGAAPIVDGVCWADCLTVLVSESAAGKTFVLLDLFAHLSAGLRWHGREVVEGSVIYVPFEGHVGLRLRALRDVAGQRLTHVYVVRGLSPISPIVDRDRRETTSAGELDLMAEIDSIAAHIRMNNLPPVVALGIDTVRGSLAGSENDSEAIAAYTRVVRRLLTRVPGAAALLAHHAGWQDGQDKHKRERGSSAFRGDVDGTLYLEAAAYDRDRGEARLTLSTLKTRDGEIPMPLHLIRRRVELPGLSDRWGRPVTSCVIEADGRTREDREAEAATKAEAETRELDLRVLRTMRDFPTATSIRTLRTLVGAGDSAVAAAVARILRAGWAQSGKRSEPFAVQPAGHRVLQ